MWYENELVCFYILIFSKIVDRATFNGSCLSSANYTCQLTLYCNAGVCTCPTGTSWIAANSTCAWFSQRNIYFESSRSKFVVIIFIIIRGISKKTNDHSTQRKEIL